MPAHRLSMPPSRWPEPLRDRFLKAFATATRSQRPRLEQAFGRWLLAAEKDRLPPELVTPALVNERTAGLQPAMATAMRQAVQAVFPAAIVFAPTERVVCEAPRDALRRRIQRNDARFPRGWREVLVPLLHIGNDGLDDGRLIQAWSIAGVETKLETLWAFTDFCRRSGAEEDVTPATVQARLAERQSRFRRGELAPASALREMQALRDLGRATFPDRDWAWLTPAIRALKKIASLQPTRNNSRLVELTELQALGHQCMDVALRAHHEASGHKARVRALRLARSGLAISLLVSSPIRVGSLVALDLAVHFDLDVTTLSLSACETKDRQRDVRRIEPELRHRILSFVEHHRRVVAPPGETALFLGARGKPCAAGPLSQQMGDLTAEMLGTRVTPHVIRNVVASFIVSEAPDEAALATTILRHRRPSTTETYRQNAGQVRAGRALGAAVKTTESKFASRGPATKPRASARLQRASRPPRPRGR